MTLATWRAARAMVAARAPCAARRAGRAGLLAVALALLGALTLGAMAGRSGAD